MHRRAAKIYKYEMHTHKVTTYLLSCMWLHSHCCKFLILAGKKHLLPRGKNRKLEKIGNFWIYGYNIANIIVKPYMYLFYYVLEVCM